MLSLRSCYCLGHRPSLSHPILKVLSFPLSPTTPFSFSLYLEPFSSTNPNPSPCPRALPLLTPSCPALGLPPRKSPSPSPSSSNKRKSVDSKSPSSPSAPSSLQPPENPASLESKSVEDRISPEAAPVAKKSKIGALGLRRGLLS
ncbi:hypothetical protein CJ030_MR6G011263 [Morella rubra]|uniref:Uncharacterized protein n=1 Tax=Morella rubra TaxID=262757 RepID=A0A6A1VAK2_9ROSI|nr:hypothetical protein CJ030_MR6G011263 [Morella rubra]